MLILEQEREVEEQVLEGTLEPATTIQEQPPLSDNGTEQNTKNKSERIPGQFSYWTERVVFAVAEKKGEEHVLPPYTNFDEEKSSNDQVQDDIKMCSINPVSMLSTIENATIFDADITHRHQRRHPVTKFTIVEETRISAIQHYNVALLTPQKMRLYQSFLTCVSKSFYLCHVDND